MKVQEAMCRDVKMVSPGQSLMEAASTMASIDAGVLPVSENDRLVGMITDRDIVIRGVAKGLMPDAAVRDVMSQDVKYCYEDEDMDHVAKNMAQIQVRRLPVMSRDKKLVGILSLGDIAQKCGAEQAGAAIHGISKPGGMHSQGNGMRSQGNGQSAQQQQ